MDTYSFACKTFLFSQIYSFFLLCILYFGPWPSRLQDQKIKKETPLLSSSSYIIIIVLVLLLFTFGPLIYLHFIRYKK